MLCLFCNCYIYSARTSRLACLVFSNKANLCMQRQAGRAGAGRAGRGARRGRVLWSLHSSWPPRCSTRCRRPRAPTSPPRARSCAGCSRTTTTPWHSWVLLLSQRLVSREQLFRDNIVLCESEQALYRLLSPFILSSSKVTPAHLLIFRCWYT